MIITQGKGTVFSEALGVTHYDRIMGFKEDRPGYQQEVSGPWEVKLDDGQTVPRMKLIERWGDGSIRTTFNDGDGKRVKVELTDFNGVEANVEISDSRIKFTTDCPLDEGLRLMRKDMPGYKKFESQVRDLSQRTKFHDVLELVESSEGEAPTVTRRIEANEDVRISPDDEIDRFVFRKTVVALHEDGSVYTGSGTYKSVFFRPEMAIVE